MIINQFDYAQTKKNIIEFTQDAKKAFSVCFNWLSQYNKKEIIVGIIDERYQLTGYIIRWGRVKIAPKQWQKVWERYQKNPPVLSVLLSLHDLFTDDEYNKYVLYESNELHGFEDDTPEIEEFDWLIQ